MNFRMFKVRKYPNGKFFKREDKEVRVLSLPKRMQGKAQVGGMNYTIKDGIVFDAKGLLKDVREMVSEAKNGEELKQPGYSNWKEYARISTLEME